MARLQLEQVPELPDILHRHLANGEPRGNPDWDQWEGWSEYILAIRARGAANFLRTESRAQVSDLLKPIQQLRQMLGRIEHADRRSLEFNLVLYLSEKNGEFTPSPKVAALDEVLEAFEKGLAWRQRTMGGLAGPWRLAHDAVDWPRVSTAEACRLVWAMNAERLQTSAWLKHSKSLRDNQAEPSRLNYDLLKTFAPRSVNRDLPSAFGRFLQDVLNVFPERDRNGNPFNASDTLKALRQVETGR